MSGFFSSGEHGILKKDFTIKERRTAMVSSGMIDLEFLRPGASFDEIFKFLNIAIRCRPRAIILHPWIYERSGYRQPVIDYHTLEGPAMLAFAVPEKRFCDHMHALEHPPHGQPKVKFYTVIDFPAGCGGLATKLHQVWMFHQRVDGFEISLNLGAVRSRAFEQAADELACVRSYHKPFMVHVGISKIYKNGLFKNECLARPLIKSIVEIARESGAEGITFSLWNSRMTIAEATVLVSTARTIAQKRNFAAFIKISAPFADEKEIARCINAGANRVGVGISGLCGEQLQKQQYVPQ